MARLNLNLLGNFEAEIAGTALVGFRSDKVRALLAFLAAEADRSFSRNELATLLWGEWDDAAARANLRKSLHRLRHALGDSADSILTITRQSVVFNKENASVDLHQFEQHAATADLTTLNSAASFYRGPLLAGLEVDGAPDFDEWLFSRRDQLYQQQLAVLQKLGELYLAQGEFALAHAAATQQLTAEPWREVAHRQLMRVFDGLGQRSEALAQFDRCVAILDEELGVPVSAETQALANTIRGEQLLTTHLYNFPQAQTAFVGRQTEINQLIARLNTPSTRLISVIGTGGIGKTRLATEAITRSVGNRAAYFVPLHTVTTQDGIWRALAEQLNVKMSSRTVLKNEVVAFLQERAPLLVFDNYEQLLPNTNCIEHLLSEVGDLQILVTSRAPLTLRAEWRLPLDGLTLDEADDEPDTLSAALELLVSISQQVQPDFAVSAENRPHLFRICQSLGGMPLALEMAGSWLNLFTPDLLAEQIAENLDFLQATRSDVPERQRSLKAVFDYSLDQLNSAERTLLTQLSVFQGTFSLKATLAILKASPLILNKLFDHALLQRTQVNRFDLHPVLRAFLTEAYLELADNDRLNAKHAAYYLEQTATITQSNIAQTVGDISIDIANVQAAWQWAMQASDNTLLAGAREGLLAYHEYRGFFAEGQAIFSAAALAFAETQPTLTRDLRLAEAACLHLQGQVDGAIQIVQSTLEDNELHVPSRIRLAQLLEFCGENEQALELALATLELVESNSAEAATLWHLLAFVYERLGPFEKREAAIQHALEIYALLDDQIGLADSYAMLANLYDDIAKYDEGIDLFRQAIDIVRRLDHQTNLARYLDNLAGIYMQTGQLIEAKEHYEQALAIGKELNLKQRITITIGNLGVLATKQHNHAGALAYYDQSLPIAQEIGDKLSELIYLGNRGNVRLSLGQYEEALADYGDALEIARQSNSVGEIATQLTKIGDLYRYQHMFKDAIPYLEQALPHFRQINNVRFLCWALVVLAECLLEIGRIDEARQHNHEARTVSEKAKRPFYILLSKILDARLEGLTNQASAVVKLKSWRNHELEHIAEVDYAIWCVTGNSADFETAKQSMETLYAETKWEWFRSRVLLSANRTF